MSEEKKSTPVPLVTQGDERYDLEDCSMKRIGLLLATALLLLTGCEKYTLDRQMEELCAKDGGVKVYETVTLPPEMFDQWGDPFLGWRGRKQEDRLGPDYRYVVERYYLKDGDPLKGEGRLTRHITKIFRRADNKLMGEAVSYGRSGGDFIAYAHPTSKSCPIYKTDDNWVVKSVFLKRGK
ncbi:MAG: hypothetical protein R3E40_03600 [Rhodocyclaceae bacterium]